MNADTARSAQHEVTKPRRARRRIAGAVMKEKVAEASFGAVDPDGNTILVDQHV
jgi:hypothetical protein